MAKRRTCAARGACSRGAKVADLRCAPERRDGRIETGAARRNGPDVGVPQQHGRRTPSLVMLSTAAANPRAHPPPIAVCFGWTTEPAGGPRNGGGPVRRGATAPMWACRSITDDGRLPSTMLSAAALLPGGRRSDRSAVARSAIASRGSRPSWASLVGGRSKSINGLGKLGPPRGLGQMA